MWLALCKGTHFSFLAGAPGFAAASAPSPAPAQVGHRLEKGTLKKEGCSGQSGDPVVLAVPARRAGVVVVPETPSCSRVSVSRVRIVLLFGSAHRARSSPAAPPGSWVFDVAGEGGDVGETEGLAVPPRL